MKLKSLFDDFVDIFYPQICLLCSRSLMRSETYVCMQCMQDLPCTQFVFGEANMLDQMFWGRVKLEAATALYWFQKGGHVQVILHHLKYKGKKEIGRHFGQKLGSEIIKTPQGRAVDLLCPVPLHVKKQKIRGFNQSYWIAKGVSTVLGKPILNELLMRDTYTHTQTHKSRIERWENVKDVFKVINALAIQHKSVLLIDDVSTTGATLEACAQALLHAGASKVSVATLAFAIN